MIRATLLIGGLLLAAGCGQSEAERAAAEHECRQRLAAASAPGGLAAGAPNPVAGAFHSAAERLSAMPREGCSADQRDAADRMKAAAERVAGLAESAGLRGYEVPPPEDRRRAEAFSALMVEIEGYDRRRAALLR